MKSNAISLCDSAVVVAAVVVVLVSEASDATEAADVVLVRLNLRFTEGELELFNDVVSEDSSGCVVVVVVVDSVGCLSESMQH